MLPDIVFPFLYISKISMLSSHICCEPLIIFNAIFGIGAAEDQISQQFMCTSLLLGAASPIPPTSHCNLQANLIHLSSEASNYEQVEGGFNDFDKRTATTTTQNEFSESIPGPINHVEHWINDQNLQLNQVATSPSPWIGFYHFSPLPPGP